MKKNVSLIVSAAMLAVASMFCLQTAQAQKASKPDYELKVSTERANATYAVGETVTFLIDLSGSKPVPQSIDASWRLTKDSVAPTSRGTVALKDGKGSVTGKLDEAGFLYCEITVKIDGKDVKGVAGAAIDPLKIQPSMPAPDDFDAFWAAQKAELAKIPANIRLTPVAKYTNAQVEVFDVKADSVGGVPVSGYLVRPRNAKAKSLPAIITLHGAGVRSSAPSTFWAQKGFISLNINAHGIANGESEEFYKNLANGELKGYAYFGRESREKTYFRNMFLRIIRGIDVLAAQPEWDGKTLVSFGTSQGAAQSIVAAALDDRVSFSVAGVAAMCDHTGMVADRVAGWPRWVAVNSGKPDKDMLEASRYYDMVNFAQRAKVPGAFTVGFIDRTCAPTSVYAMYNAWGSDDKKMFDDLPTGHRNTPEAMAFMNGAILDHAKAQKAKKR